MHHVCTFLLLAACSEIEHKVDQMSAELTQRQVDREDSALQYKRYLLEFMGVMMCCCIDHPVCPLSWCGLQ